MIMIEEGIPEAFYLKNSSVRSESGSFAVLHVPGTKLTGQKSTLRWLSKPFLHVVFRVISVSLEPAGLWDSKDYL